MPKSLSNTDRYYAKPEVMAHLLGICPATLDEWIAQGRIREDVHFIRISNRLRLFDVVLMRDRLANWHDDVAHQHGIQMHLATLPSNQTTPTRCRVGARHFKIPISQFASNQTTPTRHC